MIYSRLATNLLTRFGCTSLSRQRIHSPSTAAISGSLSRMTKSIVRSRQVPGAFADDIASRGLIGKRGTPNLDPFFLPLLSTVTFDQTTIKHSLYT